MVANLGDSTVVEIPKITYLREQTVQLQVAAVQLSV